MLNSKQLKTYLSLTKKALWQHYTAPQADIFFKLRNGCIYFFVGLITMYMVNANMPSSILQETIFLAGLILCSIGFVLAMMSYIRLVISRLLRFFTKNKETDR